ncbi:MAG: pilus assembly protein PilM [Patescibacteria group bacterium]
MIIQNPFAGAFGLDIGDLSIKLVQLAPVSFLNKKNLKIKELRATSLPPGLIVNGEIQQPELVRKKILHLLGKESAGYKKSIRSSWVAANLPEPKTFLKYIEIENPDNDEITSVDIAYHAKKHLPYELEETYIDWQRVEKKDDFGKTSKILLGASPKAITDSYDYLLESVGLNPISLEIEAISLARALITADKDYKGEARCILDLGATRSSLIIYDNDSIQFSTTLNFSGEIVTSAIEQELKIDHIRAENLKIEKGLNYDSINPKYLPIVTTIAEDLIVELKTAVLFYKEHFNNTNPVTHITMCGGMANWKNIDNFISRKLKISAHPGHPWKNLFNKSLKFDQAKSLSFSTAIGLALRAVQDPFLSGYTK